VTPGLSGPVTVMRTDVDGFTYRTLLRRRHGQETAGKR